MNTFIITIYLQNNQPGLEEERSRLVDSLTKDVVSHDHGHEHGFERYTFIFYMYHLSSLVVFIIKIDKNE